MEEARVALGEVAVGRGDAAKIGAPVLARMGQGDGRERPVGDRAQQLVLGPEMMQHRHGVDADAEPKLPHGKAGFALLRQHVEGRIQNGVAVEAPPPARPGFGTGCFP